MFFKKIFELSECEGNIDCNLNITWPPAFKQIKA